ncbi:hypothetical protein [Pectobacterium brasiliense]|uniref:hypothetical protein n=1 Tax=Pectobacterium brasiliense TaxID=180957 RepID=UPI000B1DE2E6|nr:hypothetical protein [Pectobacterium brasiliense]MBN3104419.1 hypothetical protein [Pectobacterium brasiliense]MBN3184423.1 hypothetical protein [Pectobacterium brasiliense]PPE56279.1 hypothetical protein F152LOC_04325 [Pectobacterium brasiliense]
MKDNEKRIEFKNGVSEILFKQAGGRCSVPRCKNPTMGPFYNHEGSVNMGVACHIYSASKNGPRGWGGKDANFISSERNGLWCCQYHASLIDKIKGKDYSVGTLFSWKELAEARTRKQMNDIPSPLGWIESIAIENFFHKSIKPKIDLSRWTLIWGHHGVGKTALLEFTASISNSKYSDRFSNESNIICEANVHYSTVDDFDKKLTLNINNGILRRLDNNCDCLLPPGDLQIIYCDTNDLIPLIHEDHIDLMQRVLNVDKTALLSLCSIGTKTLMAGEIKFEQGSEYVKDELSYEDDEYVIKPKFKLNHEPFFELYFKSKESKRDSFIPFHRLATSERAKLILDLQITMAREIAKQRLTLLIIEDLAVNFSEYNFKNLLQVLENEDFQVIVSIPPSIENSVIDKRKDGCTLQEHEYLASWRLSVLS